MIRIITDSTSDISTERAAQLKIDIVRLTINFADRSYVDGIELSNGDFYKKLAAVEELPTTSQASPSAFEALFRTYIEAGDEIICILLSSKLSGTFQSAMIAKQIFDSKKIHLIDSQSVSFGLSLLVEIAVRLREAGSTAESITDSILSLIPRQRLVAVVSALKYLKMGGRLSATSAMIGNIMGIRPIISIQEGRVVAIGKVKGLKSAFDFMMRYAQKEGICLQYPVAFGNADSPELMQKCIEWFQPLIGSKDMLLGEIGSVVGTHAGPGAAGVAYIANKA